MTTTSRLTKLLTELGAEFSEPHPGHCVVTLPGVAKQRTIAQLILGEKRMSIAAFVCRAPAENLAEFYGFILRRNNRPAPVAFALDDAGDVFLAGTLPLAALDLPTLDDVLGAVASIADETFNDLLRIGFSTAIHREWAWRTRRGEDRTNLRAFEAWLSADTPE